ncbi:MAG: T9SS type A sorting domain-containing protein [Fluviicola sp.]|nr:T9SS type A sorting domain-containing protein [Fluviicola sp.]
MKTGITILLFFIGQLAIAQNAPCYFDEYTNNNSIKATEQIIQDGVEQLQVSTKNNDSIKVIPVVVHVLHTGGSENISLAQIQSQIDIMNEDYGRILGSNGYGNGVDTRVRFCLAKIDPNGNCTDGVVRIFTSLADHKTYERAMLKQLSFWDNTMYMNIYIVKSITGGVLGYSSFPGGPPDEDGMVMRHNVFGNIGTASSSLGRTAAHEIGHWFGLYHTFNNGCGTDLCTDGDYVCDTPPQDAPSFNCAVINSCSNDSPDVDDQKENYMSYTNDACKNMFTNGQKLRIQSTLDNIRTNIWSQTNLLATGCDSLYTAPAVCAVIANFVTLTPTVCIGNTIDFMDISLNNATSWQWTFNGGTPNNSNVQNPSIVYNTVGNYPVKLLVSDGVTTDSVTFNLYIDVTTPGIGAALPFAENFDSGIFPPNNLTLNNPDGGVTWELDSAAYVSPNYSARIDNLINTNYGSADEIVLPYLDFTTYGNNLYMAFDWAYARSDASFSDELIVLLSTDCGVNYNQVFYGSGNGLVSGPTQTTPFIPDSSQWKRANFSLYAYRLEQYVQIKIVNVTDGGNRLYIDNINIGEFNASLSEKENNLFTVYPNPATNLINVSFKDQSNKVVRLYNTTGQVLQTVYVKNEAESIIDVTEFSQGIFYIEVEQNGTVRTEKVIIN